MTKLIIFDLDGTLLDTRTDIAMACNYALRSCGCPERKLEEYNMLVGRGIYNLFRAALPEEMRSEENVMRMKNLFVPYYDEHIADNTKPYPGIIGMLDALASHGVEFAVASNKYEQATKALIDTYFPEIEWCAVFGQREGVPTKPDPTIVNEILAVAGITDKSEVLYVGDSGVDMQTAINAGLDAVGVSWGCRSRQELESFSPLAVVDTCEEIFNIIQK